ncbi:LOC495931 protein-like protein [Wallemia mellicola]|uniref:LOC495931 protein-like protein n=1 Tax=Wallemia mellicola TaxID=1708541 RepID=A0A4T0QYZ1_9BASI|nr:LOC495931 protein-like protein [Wallemia mellicola]
MSLNQKHTALFVCDVQAIFSKVIKNFDAVMDITNKMVQFSKILNLPVLISEQNPSSLGNTAPEINFNESRLLTEKPIPKTRFSMVNDDVLFALKTSGIRTVLLVGIETHICILQTSLELLENGYEVQIILDGVSSSHSGHKKTAIEQIKQAGGKITTSETVLFQLMSDSSDERFKSFLKYNKEYATKSVNALDKLTKL